MSKPTPPVYRTTNWRAYNAALRQRGSLSIWFDPETQWLAAPNGRRGRQPVFSAAAIQTCLTLRALFGLPLRQVTGMVASLLALAGLDWPVPDYSPLCRRQKGLLGAIAHRPGTGALHLLIDSTGIKAEGCGEWCAKKHRPSKPRQWRKVQLGIDAETLEIRAIEVTGAGVGDAPLLPELLQQIPVDQPIAKSVPTVPMTHGPAMRQSPRAAPLPSSRPAATADPGKRIARCRCPQRHPPHHQPPWANGLATMERQPPSKPGRNHNALLQTARRARPLTDFDRQVAELQIRAAILNRFTALGPPLTQRVE